MPTLLIQNGQSRVKNKGSQSHKRGPKRDKYQAPKPEHPDTPQTLMDKQIHANHQEAQNAAYRRKISAYRRKTNTYAKVKRDYKERWTYTGSFITLSANISALEKFLP